MSSRPDPPGLEGFIDDSFFFDRLPPGARERVIAFYEPQRAMIERLMVDDYDPEEMSWRSWRNSLWDILPGYHEELFMSDEDFRAIERAALAGDPAARTRLTVAMIRRRSGVVIVWMARQGHESPLGPAGTVRATLNGYADGGEIAIAGASSPPEPSEKRAWLLASLNVREAIFGREAVPERQAAERNGLLGPWILELETGLLVRAREGMLVSARSESVTVETDGVEVES